MKRRIEIFENGFGRGQSIAHYETDLHNNSILERDIAAFILKIAKDPNLNINPVLISKYLISNTKGLDSISELIEFALHPAHFKPSKKGSIEVTQHEYVAINYAAGSE